MIEDKIQYTDIATLFWLEGPHPDQKTLEVIEKKTLLVSKKFKRCDINQVELIAKHAIIHPGKQSIKKGTRCPCHRPEG